MARYSALELMLSTKVFPTATSRVTPLSSGHSCLDTAPRRRVTGTATPPQSLTSHSPYNYRSFGRRENSFIREQNVLKTKVDDYNVFYKNISKNQISYREVNGR